MTKEMETDNKQQNSRPNKMTVKKNRCLESLHKVNIDVFSRRSEALTIDTTHSIIRQLGYLPYNLVEVAAHSEQSPQHPLILKLYPLNTNDLKGRYAKSVGQPLPFPTLFWMSCPALHTKISELEDAGWIQVFQKRLLEGPESAVWLEMMDNAHRQYAAERWSMLSGEDLELVERNGWLVYFCFLQFSSTSCAENDHCTLLSGSAR